MVAGGGEVDEAAGRAGGIWHEKSAGAPHSYPYKVELVNEEYPLNRFKMNGFNIRFK